jgi:hypothetical protein
MDEVDEDGVVLNAMPPPKSFLAVLAEQRGGQVVNELSKELHNLIVNIEDHFEQFRGKVTGSLSLTMKFTLEGGAYKVESTFQSSRPKAPASGTIMWLDHNGDIGTANPRQLQMPFAASPINKRA